MILCFLVTVHKFVIVGHQKFTVDIVNTLILRNTAFGCVCVRVCMDAGARVLVLEDNSCWLVLSCWWVLSIELG